ARKAGKVRVPARAKAGVSNRSKKKKAKAAAKTSSPKRAVRKASKKSSKQTRSIARAPRKSRAAAKSSGTRKRASGAKPPKTSGAPTSQTPSQSNTFYITTAIAYLNGVPHIGHAYEAIATDALARFQRLDGKDVFFLTGTDEHGLKMVQTAARENMSVPEFAERNAGRFKAMDERLNVSFNRFIRTTEADHHISSQVIR